MNNWKTKTALFFLSQSITLLGSQIVAMAVVWYVTLATGSGAWVAAFSLCAYLPQFLLAAPGGAIADRYSRKVLILLADGLIAVVTLGMLLAMPYIKDEKLLPMLLLMSLLRSAGAGIQAPAVSAVVPTIVPEDQRLRCNGINATMQSLVQFASPPLAAVLLASGSLRSSLCLDIVTAAVGMGIIAVIALPLPAAKENGDGFGADMKAGLRYAITEKQVLRLLAIYGAFVFLTVPAGYLSGLLVTREFGDTYWHLTAVEITGFGGMMAGGLVMSFVKQDSSKKKLLALSLIAFGVMAGAMGISRIFPVYLTLMVLYGVALTATQTTITTLLQQKSDADMQGRVFGFMSGLYAGCYPLGMIIFGPMADAVPLRLIMVLSGAALILLALAARKIKE